MHNVLTAALGAALGVYLFSVVAKKVSLPGLA